MAIPSQLARLARAGSRRAALEWCLPALLGAGLFATGVAATPCEHSPVALLVVAALYALLALGLHLGARFAMRAGLAYGVPACLALAVVPAAALRVDAEVLTRAVPFALFVLVVAALYGGALWWLAPRKRALTPRNLLGACAAFALLALGVGGAARASDELRWHLLRHHSLFGTPLYWLASRPLTVERDALWERGRLAAPAEQAGRAPEPPVVFQRPPHVVFVLLDTLRADALAALGGAPGVMPAMNALAERSTLFTDVHANASWTRASCASMFTGLLPEEHGAARFHEKLSEDWHTLPEQMRAAGYQTAAFVANWVQVGRQTGFAQGFEADDFHELMGGDEILAQAGAGAGEAELRGAYARAERVNRAALEWLASDARDPYRPLFLYLHYLDPHAPYLEPPEPGTQRDPHERRRGLYRQQLRYLDRQLAQLFERLERELSGPKVIVVTSDHGEEFFEHDDWGHGHTLYKELVWVPLLVHRTGEAGARGLRVDAPLEGRDLFTLVQDLVRDPGQDLAAWGAQHARPVRYASQYLDRTDDARPEKKWTGLRRLDHDGHALIWSAFGPTLELYDEERDPGELENRADRERPRLRELQRELERAVRFWSVPTRVERSAAEVDFLRALGYVGGP